MYQVFSRPALNKKLQPHFCLLSSYKYGTPHSKLVFSTSNRFPLQREITNMGNNLSIMSRSQKKLGFYELPLEILTKSPRPKKLGFFDLPLEIRQMIYAYILPAQIDVRQRAGRKRPSQCLIKRTQNNIPRTSNAWNKEISEMLCSRTIISLSSHTLIREPFPLDDHEVDLIQHVRFSLDYACVYYKGRHYERTSVRLAVSYISRFRGMAISRKSCEIDICPVNELHQELTQEPWRGAIDSLVGFETLVLTIRRGWWERNSFSWVNERRLHPIEGYFRTSFPSLGPCVVSTDDEARRYVFHPRKHNLRCA